MLFGKSYNLYLYKYKFVFILKEDLFISKIELEAHLIPMPLSHAHLPSPISSGNLQLYSWH